MIGLLIQLIMLIIVLGVLYFIAKLVIQALGLPGVVLQIVTAVILLILALWCLNLVAGYAGTPLVKWR